PVGGGAAGPRAEDLPAAPAVYGSRGAALRGPRGPALAVASQRSPERHPTAARRSTAAATTMGLARDVPDGGEPPAPPASGRERAKARRGFGALPLLRRTPRRARPSRIDESARRALEPDATAPHDQTDDG